MAKAATLQKPGARPKLNEPEGPATKMWTVFDNNQNKNGRTPTKPREHIIAGTTYRLYRNDGLKEHQIRVPEHHARMFLKHKAFEVYNELGEYQSSISANAQTKAGQDVPKLAKGEVIANLSELSDEALRVRAIHHRAGQDVGDGVPRDALIALLLGDAGEVKAKPRTPFRKPEAAAPAPETDGGDAGESADGVTEVTDAAELDKMFEAA